MIRADVVLVCGVQGSGKSWVCRQLVDKFRYIAHDRCWWHPDAQPDLGNDIDAQWGPPGSKSTQLEVLAAAARARAEGSDRRVILTEVPFGERTLRDQLERAGVRTEAVFVIEPAEVLRQRYLMREGRPPEDWVLSRAAGLGARARSWGAFAGTSSEVLAFLRDRR